MHPRLRLSLLAVLLVLSACTSNAGGDSSSPGAAAPTEVPEPPAAGSMAEAACSIPHIWLLRQWRGYYPGRSPDIIMLTHPPNYMGNGYPHVGPWNYLERVPFFLYGPGYIKPAGVIKRPMTLVDWAPTQAELLGFDHRFPDGHALTDALFPAADRPDPPRLIVTVVWDAGGRDVLSAWPNSWPHLKSLRTQGVWYDNATDGSAPVSTAQVHPILGTGAFPRLHGIVGNHLRIGNHVQEPYEDGPILFKLPTLADLYDKALANKPKVGLVGASPWHLGMMGQSNHFPGGDTDIAVLHQIEGPDWDLPFPLPKYYRFPQYVNDAPPLTSYFRYADASDGKVDGTWRGHQIEDEGRGFNTPARIPYQTRAIEDIIRHEGFGKDAVPDLFFTNYKLIDHLSHIYTMNSLEMKDAVVADDAYIPVLIRFLNKWVGQRKWVMLLTADHGAMPDPQVTGAYRGSTATLKADINSVFDDDGDGRDLILNLQPAHIFLDLAELKDNGFTLGQISAYISKLTEDQLAASDSIIKQGQGDDLVFQAVFPSKIMPTLSCLPEARESP